MLKLENALMIAASALILYGAVTFELIATLIGFGVLIILIVLSRSKPAETPVETVEVAPETAPAVEETQAPTPAKPKAPRKPRAKNKTGQNTKA